MVRTTPDVYCLHIVCVLSACSLRVLCVFSAYSLRVLCMCSELCTLPMHPCLPTYDARTAGMQYAALNNFVLLYYGFRVRRVQTRKGAVALWNLDARWSSSGCVGVPVQGRASGVVWLVESMNKGRLQKCGKGNKGAFRLHC